MVGVKWSGRNYSVLFGRNQVHNVDVSGTAGNVCDYNPCLVWMKYSDRPIFRQGLRLSMESLVEHQLWHNMFISSLKTVPYWWNNWQGVSEINNFLQNLWTWTKYVKQLKNHKCMHSTISRELGLIYFSHFSCTNTLYAFFSGLFISWYL